jgi:hypothetical protein
MTLDKIIYDVRESLKQYADDSEIDNRYIIYLYNIKRAKYLRQDLNNYQRTTDQSVTQTLCLGLERVSINECDIDYNCETILRTKKPIPQPLELHIKSAITSVKSTKRIGIPFNFTTKAKAIYSKNSPFSNAIFSFLDNDRYIYLLSNEDSLNLLECITITGVFEDPLELKNYTTCCNCNDSTPCFNESTTNYPIQPHYIDLIKNEIIKDLTLELSKPEDKENDSNNDN